MLPHYWSANHLLRRVRFAIAEFHELKFVRKLNGLLLCKSAKFSEVEFANNPMARIRENVELEGSCSCDLIQCHHITSSANNALPALFPKCRKTYRIPIRNRLYGMLNAEETPNPLPIFLCSMFKRLFYALLFILTCHFQTITFKFLCKTLNCR